MKRMEHVSLSSTPYRLSYRHYTDTDYNGYYHCHQGMEFLFIHHGHGRVTVGNQVIDVAPGTLLFFQPFQLHRIQMDVTAQQPYERTIVSLEPTVFSPYLEPFPHVSKYYNQLWHDELPIQSLHGLTEDSELPRIFHLFHRRLQECTIFDRQHEFGIFTIRLIHTLLDMGFGDPKSSEAIENIRLRRHSESIMAWIEEHYSEAFTLSQLADDLHLTKTYISRIFRAETGSGLMEYVTARRIRQAQLLLHATDLPVEHIGAKVGIPNFSYFCQIYKKHTGLSPNQSRKQVNI